MRRQKMAVRAGAVMVLACLFPGLATAQTWPQKQAAFRPSKPLMGLPADELKPLKGCASDGTTYLSAAFAPGDTGATMMPQRFAVSASAEVKPLYHGLPMGFVVTALHDTYIGERAVVSLVEAGRRTASEAGTAPAATQYYLVLDDRQVEGDSRLVPLDFHFKPLKIAMFGSGRFLLLAWDEANLVPFLAVLKDDGSVAEFVQTEHIRQRRTWQAIRDDPHGEGEFAPPISKIPIEGLRAASFVPYGDQVLLTFPSRNEPVHVLSDGAEDMAVPLLLPGGYVLKELLGAGGSWTWVVRAAPKDESKTSGADQTKLFEMNAHDGSLYWEWTMDSEDKRTVTCAAQRKLTVIRKEAVADAAAATNGGQVAQTWVQKIASR